MEKERTTLSHFKSLPTYTTCSSKKDNTIESINYKNFIDGNLTPLHTTQFTFISLFSGAGIGDFGLKLAGGKCLAACEIDKQRQNVHFKNLNTPIFGNIREEKDALIASLNGEIPDLLIATPPCQSFSTANARRGLREDPDHATRDERNHLFFEALYIAKKIKPKFVIFENVPNFLERKIRSMDGKLTGRVEEFIRASLMEYIGWSGVICFSKLGVPQKRRRSLAIFVRNDCVKNIDSPLIRVNPNTWSLEVINAPKNILEALADLEPLDSVSIEYTQSSKDCLHQIPVSDPVRYKWISDIEPNSGRSAWENKCYFCGDNNTPIFTIDCIKCGKKIINRPHIEENGVIRSIKGFKTSYKRISPLELAPTITTNTNSFSSDSKIHPNQNRVLSVREVALLQSIPYSFKWPKEQFFKTKHLVREMVGEAVPPLVTYQLGLFISKFMND